MKKIAYIGHSYHLKTDSTLFLREMLKEKFCVDFIADESWNGKPEPELSHIDEKYHAVIFFQSISKRMLKKISCKNIIYIPMYDGCGNMSNYSWYGLRDVKIINFSSRLDENLQSMGFNTLKVKYFPEVANFCTINDSSVFFWQRTEKISWDLVRRVIGSNAVHSIHIHRAVDPNCKFLPPSREDEEKFNITYSDWFRTKGEYWNVMSKKAIYVAPRWQEGIGMSFLEAMAMGKAVIAIDQPTMNEYIKDGYNGYLIDINNIRQIDLTFIDKVKLNAYNSIKEGRVAWLEDIDKILNFIDMPMKKNFFFEENILLRYKGVLSVRNIKNAMLKNSFFCSIKEWHNEE